MVKKFPKMFGMAMVFTIIGGLLLFYPHAIAKAPLSKILPGTDVASANENTQTEILQEAKAEALLQDFIDKLVQETDENYQVKGYQSKEQLIDDFAEIADLSLAKKYVDYYYEDRNNKLYIIPTELPPWFNAEQSYHFEKLAEGMYKLEQRNQTDLYGSYKITVHFSYDHNRWMISEIIHE